LKPRAHTHTHTYRSHTHTHIDWKIATPIHGQSSAKIAANMANKSFHAAAKSGNAFKI